MKLPLTLLFTLLLTHNVWAKDSFNVCWSHYVGWEPWSYIASSGVMARWASRYGIEVNIERVDDYLDSLTRFSQGEFDACTMTQMDALAFPAAKGVDSSVLIIGDYSNGNDGILSKSARSVAGLKGQDVLLVQYSVSHYLLARALESVGLQQTDLNLINISDTQILSAFQAGKAQNMVIWNPILQKAQSDTGARLLFDSSDIQGEILDLMVVKTAADDRLKRALAGAWYEVMQKLQKEDLAVISAMAESAGMSRVATFQQLGSTKMLYQPAKAAKVAKSKSLRLAMERVRRFCFEQGLLGSGAEIDAIGIEFPDGSVLGDSRNIKFRINSHYMELAAQQAL